MFMKFIDFDLYNVEYVVIMKDRKTEKAVYTYKFFTSNDEVNENRKLIREMVEFFEKMHPDFFVERILTDATTPCGFTEEPVYEVIFPWM